MDCIFTENSKKIFVWICGLYFHRKFQTHQQKQVTATAIRPRTKRKMSKAGLPKYLCPKLAFCHRYYFLSIFWCDFSLFCSTSWPAKISVSYFFPILLFFSFSQAANILRTNSPLRHHNVSTITLICPLLFGFCEDRLNLLLRPLPLIIS